MLSVWICAKPVGKGKPPSGGASCVKQMRGRSHLIKDIRLDRSLWVDRTFCGQNVWKVKKRGQPVYLRLASFGVD